MARRFCLPAITLVFAIMALPSPAFAVSSSEAKFISLINDEREDRGIKTLVTKNDLVAVARKHSARMAEDGTIYHNDNLKSEVSGSWWALGENVGMGPTVDSLHQAFMDSPGHRANILDKDYNQIGVGVVVKDETIYVTEVFAGRKSTATVTVSQPAPKPAPPVEAKPAPPRRPRPPAVPVRTMDILLLLAGLDAERIDPANGQALGL